VTTSNKELLNFISNNNTNLIVSKKGYHSLIPVIITALNEYAINNKNRVYMYCFENQRAYYISKLISLLTELDISIIHNYIDTCNSLNSIDKNVLNKKDYDNYLSGMKKIIESDLLIANYTDYLTEDTPNQDPVDTILYNFSSDELEYKTEIIIIDSLELLEKYSKYTKEEIINRIKNYSNKYNTKFIIFDKWDQSLTIENIDNIVTVEQIETEDNTNKLILDNNNTNIEIELITKN